MKTGSLTVNNNKWQYSGYRHYHIQLPWDPKPTTCRRICPLYMLSGNMVAHIINAVTIAQKLSAMKDWLVKKTKNCWCDYLVSNIQVNNRSHISFSRVL